MLLFQEVGRYGTIMKLVGAVLCLLSCILKTRVGKVRSRLGVDQVRSGEVAYFLEASSLLT